MVFSPVFPVWLQPYFRALQPTQAEPGSSASTTSQSLPPRLHRSHATLKTRTDWVSSGDLALLFWVGGGGDGEGL
jgi:hypothetical protein